MKTSSKLAIVLIAAAVLGCDKQTTGSTTLASDKVAQLEAQVKAIKDREEANLKLGQYAINMMYRAGAGKALSDGKKLVLARSIVRVANDIFDTEANKRGFITVLAIESGFNRFAQSPTGPKGYGQLAKRSFHEAMRDCGLDNMKDEDVWETDLNLYAAACYFKKMLDGCGNDPYIAIVSYNQGPNSEAAKNYAKYGSMDNTEALKYVARFNFLSRKVTDEKQADVPAIQELPKPAPTKKHKAKK